MEIESKTVALPRLNDPLGRDEEDVSRRLRAMAADALAGKNDDAAEAEAEAVARLLELRSTRAPGLQAARSEVMNCQS